jgi:hypothetical protein
MLLVHYILHPINQFNRQYGAIPYFEVACLYLQEQGVYSIVLGVELHVWSNENHYGLCIEMVEGCTSSRLFLVNYYGFAHANHD